MLSLQSSLHPVKRRGYRGSDHTSTTAGQQTGLDVGRLGRIRFQYLPQIFVRGYHHHAVRQVGKERDGEGTVQTGQTLMSYDLSYGMASAFIVAQLKALLDRVQGAHNDIVAESRCGTRDGRTQRSKIVGFGRHGRSVAGMLSLLEDGLDGLVGGKVQRVCGDASVDDRLDAPPKTREALSCIGRDGALRHGNLAGETRRHRFDGAGGRPGTGRHAHVGQTRLRAGW